MAHSSILLSLKRAAMCLCHAQDIAEQHPGEYSQYTWELITEALELVGKTEDLAVLEESSQLSGSIYDFD